jgi:hypothetical protein
MQYVFMLWAMIGALIVTVIVVAILGVVVYAVFEFFRECWWSY